MDNHKRIIPGLSLPVSSVFFGTAMPPLTTDSPDAEALLDSVLTGGVNAFDCARSYGLAEKTLGRWIRERGIRDQVAILSKCGDIRNGKVEVNHRVIREQLAQSLDALETDCIDLYLLHRDDPGTPVEEFIETLNEAQKKGMIRLFGASNWTHERIAAANRYAEKKGVMGFSVSSPNYGLTRQMKDLWGGGCITISGPENEAARAWYRENQMPVIAYSSLGRGFFSGRFKAYDYESARNVLDSFARQGYLYEQNMARLARAEELARKFGVTVPEIAMRYVFGSGMNVFAVVSTTSPRRLQMNLHAAAQPLNARDIAYLEGTEP
ncbi:MAG: aldo/keto reductase [Clostridia bacterium]|nr:aldo/keto reductase [Clostridia bacterium]